MAAPPRLIEALPERREWRVGNWPVRDLAGAALLGLLAAICIVTLVLPMVVVVLASFDSGPALRFPPQTFSFERYAELPQLEGFLDAVWLSLGVAFGTVCVDVLLGVPAAVALVRGRFRGKAFLVGFIQSPMMVPGIVVGISILFFLSFIGLNVSIPLMLLSHVVVTLPFVVRITYARMESANRTLEEAAEDLGASRWLVFRHVILPHLVPGIAGGSALAFLLSFDNVPVSVFTAPVIDPPLPVYLLRLLLYDINPIVAPIATLQIVITVVILAIAARTVGASDILGGSGR
jgi:putative spermidine/putrescine transport system permease protein